MRARSHSEPLAALVLDSLLDPKLGTILVPTFFKSRECETILVPKTGTILVPKFGTILVPTFFKNLIFWASPGSSQWALKSTSDLASPWASVKPPIQRPNGYPFGGPDEAPDRSPNGSPDGSPNGGADESPNGDQIGAQMDAELEAS